MEKSRTGLYLALVIFLLAAGPIAADTKLYVAPDGNDEWSGRLAEVNEAGDDGPLATPNRALSLLSEIAKEDEAFSGATVYLRAGAYHLHETLLIGPELSGTEEKPFLLRSYPGERASLYGGPRITGFKEHEGSIQVADVSGLGETPRFLEVYWQGARQIPARWPNKGEGDLPGGGWTFITGSVAEDNKRSFLYTGSRPQAWSSLAGVEVSIWPNYNWWQTIEGVEGIDAEAGSITLAKELPYTIEPGRRFFFQHVREELDAPGEWFHDTEAQQLYFWTPEEEESTEVIVPLLDAILKVEGASHVSILDIHFAASRGAAVVFENCTASLLAKSTIENVYGYGVTVRGGEAVRVRGNDILETGRGGVHLEGGDRATLTTAGHEAENNHIHHFARVFQTYQTAVNVQGVGNRVRHNLIHDAPHIGILMGGNEHLIEYNEIHHVCLEGSDNGAIYMGRDWTQRGNVIRFNKIHDIYGFGLSGLGPDKDGLYQYESPHQAWGVYLDDCTSGVTVHGNLFYRVPLCGVMIGGGRDNVVENNIFFDSVPALHIDDRWDSYPWALMQERLEAMNYQEPPYSERYPELLEMGDDPRRPANNRFVGNVVSYTRDDFRGLSTTVSQPNSAAVYNLVPFDPPSTTIDSNLIDSGGFPVRVVWRAYQEEGGTEVLSWTQWREKGFDSTSVLGSPRFLDVENDDFELHRHSDAYSVGFPRLPISRMGLYNDELRASWPPPKDTRRDGMEHRAIPVDLNDIE